jgi:putative membrane protein
VEATGRQTARCQQQPRTHDLLNQHPIASLASFLPFPDIMAAGAPQTLDSGTRLAVDRTRLAYERTQMAWVRTAASLISFGFTIYKFFQFELKGSVEPAQHVIGPRGFALIMISTGLLGLIMADIQHRASMKLLKELYGDTTRSVAGIVGWVVGLLGALALLAVVIRA